MNWARISTENIRKNQSKLKGIITEIKKTLEEINSKLEDAEEWVSDVEGRGVEIIQVEQQINEWMNEWTNVQGPLENIMHTDGCFIGAPESREKVAENLFVGMIAENFSNLRKETGIQVQEVQRTLNLMNPKRSTPRHILIKTSKVKNKESLKSKRKATRET